MSREEIISQNPIAEFVRSRGHELKRAGENFVTSGCPMTVHQKYHRPVSIDIQKQVWHCNDCGIGGSVVDWIMHERGCDAAQAMRKLVGGGNGKIVCAYDYTDEAGNLLYQTCRYSPKDFKQRRPDDSGGWIWNIQGRARVLYRLPEVLKAETVCITEGEKDADNLCALGFTATTNPLGAKKWLEKYSDVLCGKDVLIFGDCDYHGMEHVALVIKSLQGRAKSIKWVTLPEGFHDVSDYIKSFSSPDEAKTAIEKLIEQAQGREKSEAKPESALQKTALAEQPRNSDPVELPPAAAPYVPPPLDLLPIVLRDYVQASAACLDVSESYVFQPLLPTLAAHIGNSRSILLKAGYVEPPIIWTGIIGPSGSLKSPAIAAGCLASMELERELRRQNKEANERYEDEIAGWEIEKKNLRGPKPEKPGLLKHVTDDLTIEVLADLLTANPRGLLIRKDELSQWFASFDQYRSGKGSDVGRWLSLHTGVFFAVDRRSDNRHYTIFDPRVSINGGIQPKTLRRVLTEDFFERGLPARFLFDYPRPDRPHQWTEAIVPEKLIAQVLQLFERLWLLAPRQDNGHVIPGLLTLTSEAKEIFVAFYNATFRTARVSDERGEAAWAKLPGQAARLALIGQLTHNPQALVVSGVIMQAACKLAEWYGHEAARIYGELSETEPMRERRELIEFIRRRAGSVTVRDIMQGYRRLKNDRDGAERELHALVKDGLAKTRESKPASGGWKTVIFQLLPVSTSTLDSRFTNEKPPPSVDVDTPSTGKITAPPEVGIAAL